VNDIDSTRYPRVASYLASLPQGLASHPQCTAKGSAVRRILCSKPVGALEPGALPQPVIAPLLKPPSHREWISEALPWCAIFAIGDYHRMDDTAFLAWGRDAFSSTFQNPVFRFFMSLASPELLLDLGSSQFGAMHRGSKLSTERGQGWASRLTLEYPDRLFNEAALKMLAVAFQVGFEQSRAEDCSLALADWSPTVAHYDARWRR